MASHQQSAVSDKRHKVEGPYKHFLAYIVSILLTMIAFATVIYGGLDKMFIVLFLVAMAIIQATFQIFVWMHAKDKGHLFPIIAIAFGFIIALTAATAAIYWMWW